MLKLGRKRAMLSSLWNIITNDDRLASDPRAGGLSAAPLGGIMAALGNHNRATWFEGAA